jgi:hypothetical protein
MSTRVGFLARKRTTFFRSNVLSARKENGCHERRKDRQYRDAAEKRLRRIRKSAGEGARATQS